MREAVVVLAVIVALVAYAAWLFSKPGEVKPLVPPEDDILLREGVQEGPVEGNSIETFTGFTPMAERLEQDIAAAQKYIHLQFFKYEDDPTGRKIAAMLAQKVAQGVEVRLLYDAAVNGTRRPLFRDMRATGVLTKAFSPLYPPALKKSDNYRNHRKIVVIDGKIAYLGGMNIADRYDKGLDWGIWRDTQIRIAGPVAAQCQLAFARDWAYKGGELLAGAKYCHPVPSCGSTKVETVCSGPVGDGPAIMNRICAILDAARTYAWLESPYLIPTREVQDSLANAVSRGVDVRIIIPPRGDRGVINPIISRSYVEPLLEAGVKIAMYKNGFMHSKTLVVDDEWTSVGSTNMDPRSYILDFEINAFVRDKAYALQMKDVFLADEAHSKYLNKNLWARRSIFCKAAEAFTKLFSAQF